MIYSNYFIQLFNFSFSLLIIFQYAINLKLCSCQEYRIKESVQLMKDWDDLELRQVFKIIQSYDEQGRRIGLRNSKWNGGRVEFL
jgi:hypothetical protein